MLRPAVQGAEAGFRAPPRIRRSGAPLDRQLHPGLHRAVGGGPGGEARHADSSARQALAIRNNLSFANGWVETTTSQVADGGLILRMVGSLNYYMLAIRDDSRYGHANIQIYDGSCEGPSGNDRGGRKSFRPPRVAFTRQLQLGHTLWHAGPNRPESLQLGGSLAHAGPYAPLSSIP